MTTWAVLNGVIGGSGLWLMVWWSYARQPSLIARLAPYLPSTAPALDRDPRTPLPTVERLLAPVMRDAIRMVERVGSPTADLERRLTRAGRGGSLADFRVEQVIAAVTGIAAGLILALSLVAARGMSPLAGVVVVASGALAGLVLHDQALSRRVRQREERLLAELPTVAELLALAVAAGEGAIGALERVARSTHGVLPEEISSALADARSGTPLTVALERMADRTGAVALARFTEAIAVALDRGTPLAEVLHAQATDVREAGRRALMETGGRKEIAMMVPVVFLVLPVTVLFAVFPGLATLRLTL